MKVNQKKYLNKNVNICTFLCIRKTFHLLYLSKRIKSKWRWTFVSSRAKLVCICNPINFETEKKVSNPLVLRLKIKQFKSEIHSQKITKPLLFTFYIFLWSQVTDELYRVHLTISKIRTRNVRSQPRWPRFMLENQTPKSISYTKLKILLPTTFGI